MRIKIALLLLAVFIVSCELDDHLFNSKQINNYKLPGNTIPESLIEQVTFDSEGNTLYGFWVKSNGLRPDLSILYCHGNKHSIDEYWDRVMNFFQLGVNVFIFDYRGYGMSEGKSSEAGLHADGEAAVNYVLSRNEVSADSLVLYGYSLGNVVSIQLAAKKLNPLCLFAESPFASANSLTQSATILDIPSRWLTEGEFDNAGNIKKVHTPFFLFHGDKDDFVRYRDNGKVVFENAPNPKSFVLIPGAGHSDIPEIMGVNNYLAEMQKWMDDSINN